MNTEEILTIVKIYKSKLADATEENIIYQMTIANQKKEKDGLEIIINNLNQEINELKSKMSDLTTEVSDVKESVDDIKK